MDSNIQLKEKSENRTSDYVCVECGVQYLSENQKKEEGIATTFSDSECGVCKKEKPTTHIRHYNYLKIK